MARSGEEDEMFQEVTAQVTKTTTRLELEVMTLTNHPALSVAVEMPTG